jgi:hypothetical protein
MGTRPAFGSAKDYNCGIREHNEELGLMHSIRSFNTAQGTPTLIMGWRLAKADNESKRTFKQLVCDELAARNGQTARENDGGSVLTGWRCVVLPEPSGSVKTPALSAKGAKCSSLGHQPR